MSVFSHWDTMQKSSMSKVLFTALNQFGARIIASEEKGCGESSQEIYVDNPCSAIAPSPLSHIPSGD